MGICASNGSRGPESPCAIAPRPRRQPNDIDRHQFIITHKSKLGDLYDVDAETIGEGAFGSVHKCTRKSTKAMYAAKEIPKTNRRSSELLRREVANMIPMDHPNIIKLFDVFEEPRKLYLVMELCTGGDLLQHIVKKGHFSECEAAVAMEQILRAVHYMHQLNICHRDLKPENFLYQTCRAPESNVLKLIDFGLSCKAEPGTTLATMAGTATYVAPEVMAKKYDKRCDLWSCGVIMYLLLCGYVPFYGSSPPAVLAKVRAGRYHFDSRIWQQVSQDAKDLIRKLLVLNPDQRHTAEQALSDPWIRLHAQAGQSKKIQLRPNLLQGFRAFRSMSRLKKAVLRVITKQMSDDQTQGLRDMFLCLDTNKNGTLSLTELQTGFARAGLAEAVPDIEEIVEGLDTNENGLVDYTEFIAAALDQESYLKENLCWTAFNVFDLDGDGKITRQELSKVLGSGSSEPEAVGTHEELLHDIDGDGDGTINFDEFMAMMARPSSGSRSSSAQTVFGSSPSS